MLLQDRLLERMLNASSAKEFNDIVSEVRVVATSLRKIANDDQYNKAFQTLVNLGVPEADVIKQAREVKNNSLAWGSLPSTTKQAIEIVLGKLDPTSLIAEEIAKLKSDDSDTVSVVYDKTTGYIAVNRKGSTAKTGESGKFVKADLPKITKATRILANGQVIWQDGQSLSNTVDINPDLARNGFKLDKVSITSLSQAALLCSLHAASKYGTKHMQQSNALWLKNAGSSNQQPLWVDDAHNALYANYAPKGHLKVKYVVEFEV